jgi:hypothetical protein
MALLTREQNAALVGLLVLVAMAQRRPARALSLASVLLLWSGWVTLIWSVYHQKPFLTAAGHFTMPFQAFIGSWLQLDDFGFSRMSLFLRGSMIHWAIALATGAIVACRHRPGPYTVAIWAGLVLAALAGPSIYCDIFSYRRVLVWHTLGLWLCCMAEGRTWPLWLLTVSGVWSIAAASCYV